MGGEKEKGGRESEEEVGEVHRSSGRGVAVGEVQGAEAEPQPFGGLRVLRMALFVRARSFTDLSFLSLRRAVGMLYRNRDGISCCAVQ